MALVAAALGLSAVSSVLGFGSSRSAKKKARRAEELAAQRSAIINVRNRRAAAAAIRRQKAAQTSLAVFNGNAGGSSDNATASSVQSQGIASLANQAQDIQLGADINTQLAASQRYAQQASNFNSLASLAGSVASLGQSLQPAPTAKVPGLPESPVN